MTTKTQETETYLAQFAALKKELGGEPPSMRALRDAAIEQFRRHGFPTTKHEEWKYTSVAPITQLSYQPSAQELNGQAKQVAITGIADCRLIFVNGRYVPKLSFITALPGGVMVTNLAGALVRNFDLIEPHLARHASFDQGQVFVALNTALMQEGAFVFIPKQRIVEDPIHLLHISTADAKPSIAYPRNLIIVEEGAQATIIESYVGVNGGVYFTNAVSEIVIGENAVVDHYKAQLESATAFHVATQQTHMARGSTFTSHNISLGGALVRNDINTVLGGRGIESTINGLYVVSGKQHVDNHTAIDHAKPYCNSHELYKGIMDAQSTAVFNGKIFVRLDAQKTDAKQTNQNLLLSRNATINTKPQLQIYADDVRCTHGATVGQLSDDALFYLRSRGIARDKARALLTYAFASDILGRIKVEPLREKLAAELIARLPQASQHASSLLEESRGEDD